MKNIITAADVNEKNIENKVKAELKKYIEQKTRKKLLSEGFDKSKYDEVFQEISNDESTKKHEQDYREFVTNETKNFYILRQELNNLNEIDDFSLFIEEDKVQNLDKLVSFKDLLNKSMKETNYFYAVLKKKKQNILDFQKEIQESKFNISKKYSKQFSEKDPLHILFSMKELYSFTKDMDGIDLYDKFEMIDNLTMSNMLSDICFHDDDGHGINNIFNYFNTSNTNLPITRKLIDNKLLGAVLRTKNDSNDVSFVTNNKTTCFDNMYVTNSSNKKIYYTRTIGELLFEIVDENLKNIDKTYRKQIYCTYDGTRPTTDEYYKWNGLQIIDIDLKEWCINGGNITTLKKHIYEQLCEFHWFLWICYSSSGKGLHIWTKVTPPHHVFTDAKDNEKVSKYWYMINYYTKSSIVYDLIYRCRNKFNFNEEDFVKSTEDSKYTTGFELKYLDNSVGRITSGIRMPFDKNVLINPNFVDLHVFFGLSQTLDGFDYKSTVNKIFLRETTISKRFFENLEELINSKEDEKPDTSQYEKLYIKGYDITEDKILPISSIKYTVRYNVCNTLASLYGKDGLEIAHVLLRSKECGNAKEINSFYSSALRNKKEPTKIGLEILKKCGVIKTIKQELKEETTNKFKDYIKKEIENAVENTLPNFNIILDNYEYLGDRSDFILKHLTNNKINMIFSPPGSGKTNYVKELAKTKRVMLVLPFISVIKNKIETDEEIMQLFDCYYGTKNINDIEYGINAVTTFDKFSKCNYEKVSKMFDYIFIDESHLLFTSSYRINATSNAIKKLKSLFYISQNDPFSAKLVLTTGTETGEVFFFSKIANIIRVYKKSLSKKIEFHICDDILDCITRMSYKIYELIEDGYKIMIPTNKGEIYSEKIIGMLEYLCKRRIKYGYYKRSNTEQEICRMINDENTVGDYEIIFCSNYLSVGVDINDSDNIKFASMYLGSFSAYEIEQFNSRIRRKGIESYYFVQTEDSSGYTNDLLLEEPNLVLRLTDEDIQNFHDDKQIAGAKQEFIAQYDPVLHNITTPGFSYFQGKIQFNLEEYELINFETKYNSCYQHPTKISRELSNYGYHISVSTQFEGLSEDLQKELKAIGIESAKQEKIKKHNLLVGTYIDLITKNSYQNKNGLEFNNVIDWIVKNADLIYEDREQEQFVKIDFDIFATPLKVVVKNKEALNFMIKPAKYLISRYSQKRCIDIITNYVDDNGILKQKQFKRGINLIKLVESSDSNELSSHVTNMIENIYNFIDQFQIDVNKRISYNTYTSFVDNVVNKYIDDIGIKINTKYGWDKIKDSVVEMINDIGIKSTSKNGIRFDYNKLPDQDSTQVLNRRSIDTMVENLFRITSEIASNKYKNSPREKHIIKLEEQEY